MLIKTVRGKRGPNDQIVCIKTWGMEKLSLKALLKMIQLFMENEDRLHPPPERGRWMLFDAISEVANGKNFSDVTKEYLMPKHVKSARELVRRKLESENYKLTNWR